MQRGFATALLLIVVVLVVLVGGYLLYTGKYSNKTLVNPSPTEVSNRILELTPKTYTGKSFSFEYPKDLKVITETEEEFYTRSGGDFRKNFKSYIGYQPAEFVEAVVVLGESGSFETNPFTMWVFDNPNNLTIEKWYLNYWYYPFVWGDFTMRRYNVGS